MANKNVFIMTDKIYCSECYNGIIVKDKLTNTYFCNSCFREDEIPTFNSEPKKTKIKMTN